ncbi:MAG: hypothetical protein Q8N91_01395 [Candidatus Omnitrophota bacterium]|nr:hypothetical protein [Candidatus Omnitrophota bacterium]
MKKKELFEKNLRLSYEFDKYVIEHLEFLAQIPDQAEIVFLPAGDVELCRENRKIAKDLMAKGGKVVFAHIGKIASPRSRLRNIRLEMLNVQRNSSPSR